MADIEENIGMKDRNRERYEEEGRGNEQEETNLDDNRPGDESVLIIDGSNPDFTRVDDSDDPSTSEIPDARRDAGNMKMSMTADIKRNIKKWFGISINKGDGPNSTLVYDKLRFDFKKDEVDGGTYKGKRIFRISKDRELIYSTDKTKVSLVNEFKEILEKAKAEHQRTPAPIAEKRAGVDLPQNVMDSIIENVKERLDIEVNRIAEEISSGTEIDKNELREFGNYVRDDDLKIVDGVDLREEKLKFFETIEIPDIEKKANKARAEGKERKAALYDVMKRAVELKTDRIRLSLNQKPLSEEVVNMVKKETDANDLTRLERFKKWARENVVGVSAIAISIAGIVTAAVMGARNVVKKGGKALGKFAKGVSKVFKKLGPLFSALGTLLSKMILVGSQGLLWLPQNLWVLFLIIATIVYNEYRRKRKR